MGLFIETALGEYAQRIQGLKGQENITFKKTLDNKFIKELIIELNTGGRPTSQLEKLHIDSEGNQLFNTVTGRTTYADSDPLGRGGKPYEVFRTGDYYDSFRVEVRIGFITITSNPFKTDNNLFEVYTDNLEGLTNENLQIVIDEALTFFIQWYQRNILPK